MLLHWSGKSVQNSFRATKSSGTQGGEEPQGLRTSSLLPASGSGQPRTLSNTGASEDGRDCGAAVISACSSSSTPPCTWWGWDSIPAGPAPELCTPRLCPLLLTRPRWPDPAAAPVFAPLSVTAHSLSEHHHLQPRGGNWKGKYDLGERATSVHSTDAALHSSNQPQGPRKPPLGFSQTFGHPGLPSHTAQGSRPLPGGTLICKFQATQLSRRLGQARHWLQRGPQTSPGGQESPVHGWNWSYAAAFTEKGEPGYPLPSISPRSPATEKGVRTPTRHHLSGNAVSGTLWGSQGCIYSPKPASPGCGITLSLEALPHPAGPSGRTGGAVLFYPEGLVWTSTVSPSTVLNPPKHPPQREGTAHDQKNLLTVWCANGYDGLENPLCCLKAKQFPQRPYAGFQFLKDKETHARKVMWRGMSSFFDDWAQRRHLGTQWHLRQPSGRCLGKWRPERKPLLPSPCAAHTLGTHTPGQPTPHIKGVGGLLQTPGAMWV